MPNNEQFDVFLCHNGEDKPEIRQIADQLSHRGLKPWLDEREIRPGTAWQVVLEEQIEIIKTAAVFVGKSGIGPWQNMEMRAFLSEFVDRACPVIPVVLPSATVTPKLPILLKSLHWVDLRETEPDPYKQLIWGITNKKPDQQTADMFVNDPKAKRGVEEGNLLPDKAKIILELRLPGDVGTFLEEHQQMLMKSLKTQLKIDEVKLTRVVAGSVRLYLELHPEDADKLYNASKVGQLAELSVSDARLYPAIAVPPDQEQRAQLLILLDRVQEYWVDGVLKQSLYHEVLISLGKHAMDEAVEPPWKHIVAIPDQRRHLLLKDRNINTVFDAMGLLLILGEPGSGKTTSLLELAAALIVRAKNDSKERVPIVLNLSSWEKNQSIEEWIAAELSAKYRIPKSIAKAWLEQDYLLPLLDGLDEVPTTFQPDCVVAINQFIENKKPSGLVVCCRLKEYQWLPESLHLNGAVCLEPLSQEDMNAFLVAGGPKLAGLQQALSSDPVLQELAKTPLMLSIMSLACEGVDGNVLTENIAGFPMARRDQIFQLYIERMFERKGASKSPFLKNQVMGWLSWLARKMKEQSQSVFMVEELQQHWLTATGQKLAYEVATALGIGLLIGLFTGLGILLDTGEFRVLYLGKVIGSITIGVLLGCRTTSPMKNGLMTGVVSGLLGVLYEGSYGEGFGLGVISGLIGGLGVGLIRVIDLVETMHWQSKQFWKKTITGSIIGLGTGVILGAADELTSGTSRLDEWVVLVANLRSKVFGMGLGFGVLGGIVGGLAGGLSEKVRRDRVAPNQGIKLSLRNGLTAFVICLLVTELILWGIDALVNGELKLLLGLFIGLFLALGIGLNRGGSAVIKHYVLRLVLWLAGATPSLSRFVPFLDHCAKLILLKKVGGGYMFIHRSLLEYFAALPLQGNTLKKSSPSSAS